MKSFDFESITTPHEWIYVNPQDGDPLHVEGPPDLTDVATHATGWYLTVLVAVAAALLVALYGWSRA